LSPALLWTYQCSYYYTNAASGRFDHAKPKLYQTRDALEGLFADPVGTGPRSKGLNICYPTDPQAEVLVFGPIDPQFVASVQVETTAAAAQLTRRSVARPVCVSDTLFGRRTDCESWKGAARPSHLVGGTAGLVEEEVPF
jgi:hypothetical protein